MIVRVAIGSLVSLLVTPVMAAEPLRYRWQPDQQFIYDVQITAELPSKVETLQGTITYQVKSADKPLRLSYRGGLRNTTKDKGGQSASATISSRRPGGPGLHGGRMLGPRL